MNVILAEGINLGLRKMADATNTHTFWELIRIDGGMSRAKPATGRWPWWSRHRQRYPWPGSGAWARRLRSDGQFFVATEQGEAMNPVNAKYGNTRA